MKLPTSSACSPKPEPDPALLPSKQPPAQPSSRGGQLSLPMRQLLPLRPVCCSKISLPTTTKTETFPRSATSFHTRAHPCLSVASQHGSGRSGLTPSLPQAHLETGQYKNSLCLEAAQYNSPVSMDLLRLKRSGGKKKKNDPPPSQAQTCQLGLSAWTCRRLSNEYTGRHYGALFQNKAFRNT